MAEPMRQSVNRDDAPTELLELRALLDTLPYAQRAIMMPLCERVSQFLRLQSRLIRIAQETVDQLNLDVKYLLFDLEATRRERDALREELENP
jgi:hypothetical protein